MKTVRQITAIIEVTPMLCDKSVFEEIERQMAREAGMSKPVECIYCHKKFGDELARWTHTKAKHPGKRNSRPVSDDDESFADRAVQADIDRMCEIDNPPKANQERDEP
jgi:hypothetical protein